MNDIGLEEMFTIHKIDNGYLAVDHTRSADTNFYKNTHDLLTAIKERLMELEDVR